MFATVNLHLLNPQLCRCQFSLYADDSLLLTRVVDTSLDDVIHSETTGGGLAPQLAVDVLGQHLQQMARGARSGILQSRDLQGCAV